MVSSFTTSKVPVLTPQVNFRCTPNEIWLIVQSENYIFDTKDSYYIDYTTEKVFLQKESSILVASFAKNEVIVG